MRFVVCARKFDFLVKNLGVKYARAILRWGKKFKLYDSTVYMHNTAGGRYAPHLYITREKNEIVSHLSYFIRSLPGGPVRNPPTCEQFVCWNCTWHERCRFQHSWQGHPFVCEPCESRQSDSVRLFLKSPESKMTQTGSHIRGYSTIGQSVRNHIQGVSKNLYSYNP